MTKKVVAETPPARTFEIAVPLFKAALKDVASIVEARNTIPILSNVLIAVTPTSVTIGVTDLDIFAERHVTIEGGDIMRFTVEAGVIGRIVDKLPADATARVAFGDGKVIVSAGRARFSLPTLPAADFPEPPRIEWTAEYAMPALALAGALGAVAFAVSTEETRYYLGGVFVHAPQGADLRFAATDGHRLARGIMAAPDGATVMPDIIVPRKFVRLLSGLLDRHEGTVDVRVAGYRICVEIGETVVQSKLIDGIFPDYTRVIPDRHDVKVSVARDELIAALGRVITISSDKTKAVKLEIGSGMIVLSASSPETGTAVEELSCGHSGPALTIGFNARYLLDILGHLTADEIEGTFTDAAAPSGWRDRDDAPCTYVLMPLRV